MNTTKGFDRYEFLRSEMVANLALSKPRASWEQPSRTRSSAESLMSLSRRQGSITEPSTGMARLIQAIKNWF